MNYNNYLYFKDKEKININDQVNVNQEDSKFLLFLTTNISKTLKDYGLEKDVDLNKVLEASKFIKENKRIRRLTIIYGDREGFDDYIKNVKTSQHHKAVKEYKYKDYSIYTMEYIKNNRSEYFVNKNNKIINIDYVSITYYDYHSKYSIRANNHILNPKLNYLLIKLFDLNYKEYLISSLVYDLDIEDIKKITNNINTKLINELLLKLYEDKKLYRVIKSAINKIVKNKSYLNIVNYSLSMINNIYNLDIYSKKDLIVHRKNETLDEFYAIMSSVSYKSKTNFKITEINLLNSYEKVKELFNNKNYLVYLNKTNNNLRLIKTLNNKYISYKEKEEVIIFEFDKSYNKNNLLKYLNDYETYTIINNSHLITYMYNIEILKDDKFNLSRLFLLSDYYNIKFDEYLLNHFINQFDEKVHQALIENKDSNLMRSIYYQMKTNEFGFKVQGKMKVLLNENKVDFNSIDLNFNNNVWRY